MLPSIALAADKPALSPDPATPLATRSRISATMEFGLPALAKAIEQDIPKRLATIDERVNCVHRRVLGFRVNANCDVFGFVDRTSGVSLYGRGDRVYGAVSIDGAAEGQGANRFTARIRGDTEARATIEAEARPALRKDWSLELNFSDSFHWSEPPYLHVLGREIDLAPYVEPRVRSQLARVRSRALAAARRLDLQGKAAAAWRHAFEPSSSRMSRRSGCSWRRRARHSPASAPMPRYCRDRSNCQAPPRLRSDNSRPLSPRRRCHRLALT